MNKTDELKINGFSELSENELQETEGGVAPALMGAAIIWAANAGLLSFGLSYYHDHVSSRRR
ncbi:MAG: class IIb bacteriocin, lactobin A/cerein 7B family [Treponema sp.]|nr:class IIb bacteriocin, lactobin A/cerein 7B family [Treponema sp.]